MRLGKGIFVTLCLAAVAITSTAARASQGRNLDFTLINKTGVTIEEIYVSPSDDDKWGKDVMGRDVLKNGEKVDITFSRSEATCKWDLKIIDEDKDEGVWENIDLCKAEEITIMWENKKPTAIIK
jgi:hypothetical protein